MNRKDKQNSLERYKETRSALIANSKLARMLIEMEEADSVNEGLIMLYDKDQGKACEYNTFNQWKEKGYLIVKGSKAFAVWGQPRNASQIPEGATEPEEYKYWPVCYLFSDLQVTKPEPANVQEPAKTEQVPEQVQAFEMESLLN